MKMKNFLISFVIASISMVVFTALSQYITGADVTFLIGFLTAGVFYNALNKLNNDDKQD